MTSIRPQDRFSPDYALGLMTGRNRKFLQEEPGCDYCGGQRVRYVADALGVRECEHCREALDQWRFESHAERSKNAIVDFALLQALARNKVIRPEIVDLAKQGPQPISLIGPTRTGKSLLLRYYYNRIIRANRGIPSGALFVSEMTLFKIFRDDESNEAFTAFCHRARDRHDDYFVIIPDAFRAKQYEGRDSGRHYSSIAWDNYFEWLDSFVLDRDCKLCVAGNVAARAVFDLGDPREAAVESRLREQSGGKEIWLDFEPRAQAPAG